MKLYNTLSHKKEEFVPIKPGKVGMYSCGPTVYNYAHIGNMRTYVFMDVLRRTLEAYGYKVKSVMNITDVRVRKIAKEGKMRAVVSITIDDEFVVHDIKVIEGEKGLFIAMPSRKSSDGEYRDIAHPINTQTRDKLQKLVLEAYDKAEDVEE